MAQVGSESLTLKVAEALATEAARKVLKEDIRKLRERLSSPKT